MDPRSLGRLVDEQGPALCLYARQWTAAPEDVVQEAFLKLVEQPRTPRNVVAWLYRVVRNGAISRMRAEGRRRHHESAAANRAVAWFGPTEEPAFDSEMVTVALGTLPAGEREAIVLHLWARLSFAEIASVTGMSSSSAHRAYVNGVARLRERLNVPCPNRPGNP